MRIRVPGQKITDPVAHANRRGGGPFRLQKEVDRWGAWAPHYTTLTRFGQVDGVRWYNNCGPTAVTNLLVMARRRFRDLPPDPQGDRAIYAKVARYGARRLIYVNLEKGPFRGTSDLRAGTYLRRMFSRFAGLRPTVRIRRASGTSLQASLDRGALLYLVLRRHPAYRNHHLAGYGYAIVESEVTGEKRIYWKVSDGHASSPRYLAPEDCRRSLWVYYEITFPSREKACEE